MTRDCLHCGKQLGARVALCYSCVAAGVDRTAIDGYREAARDRVERYFILASLKCGNCGSLHGTVTTNERTYTAEDFDIETLQDWRERMDRAERWIVANPDRVRAVLPALATDWPNAVLTLREELLR